MTPAIPASDKYLCFGCKAILVGSELSVGVRCPHCKYLLIRNTAPVALGAGEIARLFRLWRPSLWDRRQRLPGMTRIRTGTAPPPFRPAKSAGSRVRALRAH